jgi:hypothetical protein
VGIVLSFSPSLPAPHTVSSILRRRREFVISELMAECQTPGCRILALGEKGLREAEAVLAQCISEGRSFTVLETDASRIEECRREYGSGQIQYVRGSLDDPACDQPAWHPAEGYQFIFGLNTITLNGLRRALALLAPGGRILLSTFTPEWAELCCEPAVANVWEEADVAVLAAGLRHDRLIGHACWRDESGAVLYLEFVK